MSLPDGSRCELCGQCGPRDQMGWVAMRYDPADPVHARLVSTLPALWLRFLRIGSRIGCWAHVHGHGCDATTQ